MRHRDASRLTKLGWHGLGGGRYALLVACWCGATLRAESIHDASQCDACRRIVAGTDGDVKVCLMRENEALVVCAGCFRRIGRRPRPGRASPRWS